MNKRLSIRGLVSADLPCTKAIIDENQMFPSALLDEMVSGYLSGQSTEKWFVATTDQKVKAIAYCASERMTNGTWNILLIAVAKNAQGQGVGTALIKHIEDVLSSMHVRVLLVETSGLPEYRLTRRFYPKCGFEQVAIIPEYYDKDEDKVVFLKNLTS